MPSVLITCLPATRDFRSLTGRGVQATVVGRGVADGGRALLPVLGLWSPDGLVEPVARAIPADRNTTTGMVPIAGYLGTSRWRPTHGSGPSRRRGRML
jgi:hypothetical protein